MTDRAESSAALPQEPLSSSVAAKRRPRVLLVGFMPPTKGGVTTFMLNLIGSHLKNEFEFVPFTTSRPPKRNVIDNCGYGALLRGGPRRILTGILVTFWHLFSFPFVVIFDRIDLVQIQASDYFVFWESTLYAIMARMVGRPVLLRLGGSFDVFHGGSPPAVRRLISAALNLPQCVIAQSDFAYRLIREVGRRGPVVILPNWSPDANIVEVLRPLSENPGFLFIAGNEAKRKGIEQILAAAAQLDRSRSPARFHLLAMTPSLIERVKALGLTNIRTIEGPVKHSRVLEAMRQNDVFLLPSHGEGFPNSLLEAMAAGMPAIVTPVAAVPEIVADGSALTIPIGDSTALADAIDKLARDPDLRKKLGCEALKSLRARYTEASALPPLAQAYRNLLEGKAATA